MKLTVSPQQPLSEAEIKALPKNVKYNHGFKFTNSIKGGVIPQEYIPAVEKGVREALSRGVLLDIK